MTEHAPQAGDPTTEALQRAHRAFNEGKMGTVEQECRSILEQQPDRAEAWVLMSTVARHHRRHEDAVEMLRRAVSLKPDNDYMQEALAEVYVELRDWRNAEPLYKRLSETRPNAAIRHALGKCAWGTGRFASARDHFEHAARAEDATPAVFISLAQAYISTGALDKARGVLHGLLKQFPREAPGWMLLALLEFSEARPGRATELMEHATRLPNADTNTHQLCAALLTLSGREDAAREALRRVPSNAITEAQWEGFQYVLARRPGARIAPLDVQVMLGALENADKPGLVCAFGLRQGLNLQLLAHHTKGDVHGFGGEPPAGIDSELGAGTGLPANAHWHSGAMDTVVPEFFRRRKKPLRFACINAADEAVTRNLLEMFEPHLQPGSMLVFTRYLGYPAQAQEQRNTFREFMERRSLSYRYVAFGLLSPSAAVAIE